MRRTPLCLGLFALSASLMGGNVTAAPGPSPEGLPLIDVLWEWGGPAIVSALESQPALRHQESASIALPGELQAEVRVPNGLPLNRAYQLRLVGEVETKDGALLSKAPIEGPWQRFDPRDEAIAAPWLWSAESLLDGAAGELRAQLKAEIALASTGDSDVIIETEPFELPVHLEIAAAIDIINPETGGALVVDDGASALYGAEVQIPGGALEGGEPQVIALRQATSLPYHDGARAWLGSPAELRLEAGTSLRAPVTLRLPVAAGEKAPGMTFWNGDTQGYDYAPGTQSGEGWVSLETQRATYWGPTLEDTRAFTLRAELWDGLGDLHNEEPCDGDLCPQGGAFIPTSVLRMKPDSVGGSQLKFSFEGEEVAEVGQCLGAAWGGEGGAHSLPPNGDVFAQPAALTMIPPPQNDSCDADAAIINNPTSLSMTHANIPGWAEVVTWLVPLDNTTYTTSTAPRGCHPDTLEALTAYLPIDDLACSSVPTDETSVSVCPVIYSCLWIRLDPSLLGAAVALNDAKLPASIVATLPAALAAEDATAFAQATQARFLFQEPDGDTLQEAAQAELMDSCRAGSVDLLVSPLGAPTFDPSSSDALQFSAPAVVQDALQAPGVFALELMQDGDPDSRTCQAIDFALDQDGDGFSPVPWPGQVADCDDRDPATNPGALELCDGLDNDCDSATDEGVTTTFYTDNDDDSFGASPVEACALEEGLVTLGSDCDDSDPSIFPEAPELCDVLDNDCDEAIDEGPFNIFVDSDHDGFGAESTVIDSCDIPPGYSALPGDCDDQRPEVSPDADEICDEADSDCDGLVDEGVTLTLFKDDDGDGFGGDDTLSACQAIPGYLDRGGDCDDSAFIINPTAPPGLAMRESDGAMVSLNCEPLPFLPFDLDEDGAPEALLLESGQDLQGALGSLGAVQAYLQSEDTLGQFNAPRHIALLPGTYEGRLWLDNIAASLVGVPGSDGSLPRLMPPQGIDCLAQEPLHHCSTLVALGGRLSLENITLEGGLGTPLNTLSLPPGADPGTRTPGAIRFGGAILAQGGALTLNNVAITGATAHYGAAIAHLQALTSADADLDALPQSVLNDLTLTENTIAPFPSGALIAPTGALYLEGGRALLSKSLIRRNSNPNTPPLAGLGAGLAALGVDLTLLSNNFEENSADYAPGAIIDGSPRALLQNNLWEGNYADFSAGALILSGSADAPSALTLQGDIFSDNVASFGVGGALLLGSAPVDLHNLLFARNTSGLGGALTLATSAPHLMENLLFDSNFKDDAPLHTDLYLLLAGEDDDTLPPVLKGILGDGDPEPTPGSRPLLADSIFLTQNDQTLRCEGLNFIQVALFGAESLIQAPCDDIAFSLLPPEGASSPLVSYTYGRHYSRQDYHLRAGAMLMPLDGAIQGEPTGSGLRLDSSEPIESEELGLHEGPYAEGGVGPITSPCSEGLTTWAWGGDAGSFEVMLNSDDGPSAFDLSSKAEAIAFYGEVGERVEITYEGSLSPALTLMGPGAFGDEFEEGRCEGEEAEAFWPHLGGDGHLFFTLSQSGPHLLLIEDDSSGQMNLALTSSL